METVITGLLLLAIFLLVYLVASSKKGHTQNDVQQDKRKSTLPDIIGPAKTAVRQVVPITDIERIIEMAEATTHNFDAIPEDSPSEIPQEELEEVLNALPDWRAEEEDMERYAGLGSEEDFATGITFGELAIAQEMLPRQSLNPSEEKTAAAIVSKIDGTELLGLLESKIGDASKRIAMLLDDHFRS